MGIQGLSGFVKRRSHELLRREQLADCHLVVDGNNLLYGIRAHCQNLHTTLGGDYASFAEDVEAFFSELQRCHITAVVIFDGGYDPNCDKLPTLCKRLEQNIERCLSISAVNQADADGYPILLMTVFIQVLRRMGVAHAQCYFEADSYITAISRRLDCAVFSDDSDFLVAGVPCVKMEPWPTFGRRELQRTCGGQSGPSGTAEYAMTCHVFRPERLLELYGMAKDRLALLATVPGNDNVPGKVFDGFFRRHGSSGYQRNWRDERILTLLRWLGKTASPQQALKEVLQTIPDAKSRKLVDDYVTSFNKSIDDTSLEFLRYAGPSVHDLLAELLMTPPAAGDEAGVAETEEGGGLPAAARPAVVGGYLPAVTTNAAVGTPVLLKPTVERADLPATALAAAPLLARLTALLRPGAKPLQLHVRVGWRAERRDVAADWQPPPLEEALAGGAAERRKLALAALGVREAALAAVPPLLQLPAAALAVWRRATAGRSGRRHVTAVLLGCVALAPADTPADRLGLEPSQAAAVRGNLTPLRRARPELFNTAATHLQYELQYVYQMAQAVNSLLNWPLSSLDVDKTLNGPLTLNVIRHLEQHADRPLTSLAPDEVTRQLVADVTEAVEAEVARH